MTDLIKCSCGLIVHPDKMQYHKDSGEHLIRCLDVLANPERKE